MNSGDFREWVIRPALQGVDLWSPVAEELLMLTAAQESKFEFMEQIRGPALGFFQIEPTTHHDLWDNFLRFKPALNMKARRWSSAQSIPGLAHPADDELVWNLRYATVIARLIYFRVREPMPSVGSTLVDLAGYWKKHYNTPLGAGTVNQAMDAYRKYVLNRSEID